jgi:hypothetical protein
VETLRHAFARLAILALAPAAPRDNGAASAVAIVAETNGVKPPM